MAPSTGNRSALAPVLLGGLIVIGISAALMDSIVSALPDHDAGRHVPDALRGPGDGGGLRGAGGPTAGDVGDGGSGVGDSGN